MIDQRLRLLLTSAGIANGSIQWALLDLLGRPVSECNAVAIPTAIYGLPGGGADAWLELREFGEMGWREFGVLELTTLSTIEEAHWLPAVEAADVIIVGGGNTGYLSYWLHESGFAARLPQLLETRVYYGVSAGSAMVTAGVRVDPDHLTRTGIYYDDEYDEAAPRGAGSDRTVPLVEFVIRPHLNADWCPAATRENMAHWASRVDVPLYAFDDESAIVVANGEIQVVSEGEWTLFNSDRAIPGNVWSDRE